MNMVNHSKHKQIWRCTKVDRIWGWPWQLANSELEILASYFAFF